MACARCSAPLQTPEQFDMGLCGVCWTGADVEGLQELAKRDAYSWQVISSEWDLNHVEVIQ